MIERMIDSTALTDETFDPLIARKTWRTLEPVHGAIYFVPEAHEEFTAVGVPDRMSGYFASRAAPLGPVGAEVVIATFFNFDPDFVRTSIEGVWERTAPGELLAARLRAADRMIRRLAPDAIDSPEIGEAADLARIAALAATDRPQGRPLFAAHAQLPWPDQPHLVLWHAQTLLREFRGDGHIAALVAAGMGGADALVTHAATGDVPAAVLQQTRQVSDATWGDTVDRLISNGWLDRETDGAAPRFTDVGRERREWVERRTDELAIAPYAALGVDRCARLRELVRPTSRSMAAALPG